MINRPWLPNQPKKDKPETMLMKMMRANKPEPSMSKVEFIARIRHITWFTYQLAKGKPFNLAINHTLFEVLKTEVQAALENPMTAREKHNAWVEARKAEGGKYGPVSDPINKISPKIVPYDELPEAERMELEMIVAVNQYAEDLWNKIYEVK